MLFNAFKAREFLQTSESTVAQMCERSRQLSDPAAYEDIKQNLESLARELFPNTAIEVYFFGSRIYGLADSDSDLDILLDIGGNYHLKAPSRNDQIEKLVKLSETLDSSRAWKVLKFLEKTTVPIIMVRRLENYRNCKFYN